MVCVLENGEFCRSFKNPNHIQKSINKLNIKGGTCQLENSILHHERLNNKTINNLQFRHFIIERRTDKVNIHHFALVYFENDKLFMESRANGIWKKVSYKKWAKDNKIILNENGKHLLYNIIVKWGNLKKNKNKKNLSKNHLNNKNTNSIYPPHQQTTSFKVSNLQLSNFQTWNYVSPEAYERTRSSCG